MINLRYHIVSLIAVFLALALGVIAGTTVIDQAIVKTLEGQRNAARQRQTELFDQNDALQRQLGLWESFGTLAAPPLVRGMLASRRVVLMAEPEARDEIVTGIEDVVAAAGGEVVGRLQLSKKWSLADPSSQEQLALALGSLESRPDELLREAAARLAERLRAPADPRAQGDLLGSLQQSGFVRLERASQGRFPARGSMVVLVASGAEEPAPPPETFTLPFLRALAARTTAAVAEPLGAAASLAEAVRADDGLRAEVTTVDHADTVPGRIALVAGLAELARDGVAEHYGVRGRTNGVGPAFAP
jgi:hypothetical protein